MTFQLSQAREAKMYNKAKCEWPKCKCSVPSYAMSGYNRTEFCDKLREYEENEDTSKTRIP